MKHSLSLPRKVTIAAPINGHSTADNKGVPMCGEKVKLYSATPKIDYNKTSEVVSVIVAHRLPRFRFPYLLSQNTGCNGKASSFVSNFPWHSDH